MSKTLTGILEVGAAIAVQFIPGLGTVAGISLGLSLAATGLTNIFGGTPKPETSEGTVKTAIPPRVTAYGISRLYGAYILYETTTNGVAVDVYAIHDGRIAGPLFFFLGDQTVALTRGVLGGLDGGAYSENAVQIDYRLGLPTETAFSQVTSLIPAWDATHRGDGVATAMVTWQPVKSKDYLKVYPNGQPALSMAAQWSVVYDWRDPSQSLTDPSTWKFSENWVVHLADYLLRFDNKTWVKHFAPTIDYWTAAADDADLPMAVVHGQSSMPYAEKTDGDGQIHIADTSRLSVGMSITLTAIDNSGNTETVTVTGISGSTVNISPTNRYAYPAGSSVTWVSTLAYPITEPRYRSCVAFKHTDAHKDVIGSLLACGDGWLSPRPDGALVVYSGRYIAPTVTIGPDEIISYSVQEGVDEENVINSIGVSYVSADHLYNTVDTDAWTDEDDIEARGKVLSSTISPQTPSFSQNRRLAKRVMAKNNAPTRGTVSTNAAGRIARGERYVLLNIVEAGTTFYNGPAEITKMTRNLQTGGVTFDWIAADPAIDDWNPAVEEGQPAPVGGRVAGEPLDAPIVTSVTPDTAAVSGDGTGIRLIVAATGPGRSDLQWSTRWRVQGASVWNEQSFPDVSGGSVTMETSFVPTQTAIEVQAVYVVGDGRVSPYSASVIGNSAAPSSRGACQFTSQSAVPLSSTDTSINIAAFSGVLNSAYQGSTMISLPAGTLSGLTAGTKYGVFYNTAASPPVYFASASPALPAFANPANIFVGWQATSSGGMYPASSDTPGYGGSGTTYQGGAQTGQTAQP